MLRTVDGALCTSIDTYLHPRTQRRVDVVGMMHFADPGYYERIQLFLDRRTAAGTTVQYERLLEPKLGERLPDADLDKAISLFTAAKDVEQVLAYAGLVSQGERLKTRASWQNRDMSTLEFLARVGLKDFLRVAGEAAALERRITNLPFERRRPEILQLLQRELVFGAPEGSASLLSSSFGRVALAERNQIALGAFDAEQRVRPVDAALVWGQMHLPGLAEGLSDRGYQLVAQTWVPAVQLQG